MPEQQSTNNNQDNNVFAADTLEESFEKVSEMATAISETITNDIKLGLAGGGKTLINCEKGIKAFVKDELAGKKNHLPDSETGVWIYYLTKGIEKDFSRTWEEIPVSIKQKLSKDEKAAASGKVILTKQQKNSIIERLDFNYWLPQVTAGKMSMDDATDEIKKAAEEKLYWEGLGYYLSPNKTQGVGKYNPDRGVIESWGGEWESLDVLKKYGIKIEVPNIIDEIFTTNKRPSAKIIRMLCRSMLRPAGLYLKQMYGVVVKGEVFDEKMPEYGGEEGIKIDNEDDLWKLMPDFHKQISTGRMENYVIKGIHIGKQPKISKSNPLIVIDGKDAVKDLRFICTCDINGNTSIVGDDKWYNNPLRNMEAEKL